MVIEVELKIMYHKPHPNMEMFSHPHLYIYVHIHERISYVNILTGLPHIASGSCAPLVGAALGHLQKLWRILGAPGAPLPFKAQNIDGDQVQRINLSIPLPQEAQSQCTGMCWVLVMCVHMYAFYT